MDTRRFGYKRPPAERDIERADRDSARPIVNPHSLLWCGYSAETSGRQYAFSGIGGAPQPRICLTIRCWLLVRHVTIAPRLMDARGAIGR